VHYIVLAGTEVRIAQRERNWAHKAFALTEPDKDTMEETNKPKTKAELKGVQGKKVKRRIAT
jgi:hypothetical protein